MNHLIYDLAIAAVLLMALWRGYRRGFVLTLCGFLAVFVALIGAFFISNALAQPAANVIRPVVEQNIRQVFQEQAGQLSQQLPLEELPLEELELPLEEVLALVQGSVVYQSLAAAFQQAVDAGVAEVTASAAQSLADFIALQVARLVIFLLAFIAVLVVWAFLSHALDLAFHLPVLNTLNRWGGAAVGLLKGCLLVFIACWLLKDGFLPPEAVQDGLLLNFFCTASPLSLLG